MQISRINETETNPPFSASWAQEEIASYIRKLISKKVSEKGFHMPALPQTVRRAMVVTSDPDFKFADLTKIIMTDQIVASKILKFANSAMFSGYYEIRSLHNAIVRLGVRTVTNLVLSVSMKSEVFSEAIYGQAGRRQWEHSIAASLVTRKLAVIFNSDPEQCFLAGLLHDIGKLVVLQVINGLRAKTMMLDELLDESLHQIIAEHHQTVGGMVAENWHFPKPIETAIRQHHNLRQDATKLDILTYLGNRICHVHGAGCDRDEWTFTDDVFKDRLEPTPAQLEKVEKEIPLVLDMVREVVS